MANTDDKRYERRSHHLIFSKDELDLPLLRKTPDLQALLATGWRIAKYEVVMLEEGYAVTVYLRRTPCQGDASSSDEPLAE